ncbi:MAG TPA: SDR family NAD(P)-dependent oxidoreductase, partial [Actinomycetales bacterium]|nr:SDR family NAD(P)-dependent oxidoreductase [Actinomycetales bacterium]
MGTALVTGGSVGIGRAFAQRLAKDGYDLVLVARSKDRLEEVASELRSRYGVEVEVLAADLGQRPDMQRVADRLAEAQRPVDVLVNNAGFGLRKSFLGSDVEDQEQMLEVLCRAVLVLSHAAGRAMSDRGKGSIINVSSVAGFAAMGTYSAAKAWVTTFSEVLAGELRG